MSALPLRPFGHTGESWPALGMGGGFPVGYAGFDTAVATVRRALDLGVGYFDTSVMYRAGASQAILGEAMAGRSEKHFLATKIGYFHQARQFRSVEAMRTQLGECLRLLRRDSVDLLQVHEADWACWWTDGAEPGRLLGPEDDCDFADAPVMEFLHEAKARGLCRRVGITGNHARPLGRLVRALDGLDAVLVAYNCTPLNVSAREHVLPPAAAKGMAVVVAGLFTFVNSLPEGWATEGSYLGPRSDVQLAQLHALQRGCGLPMTELALRFVAADARLSTILVGACHPEEMEQNAAAFARGPLPADLHAAVETIAAQF
jgi:aryl-alcohol dehydrogenase-like predicted oxidoreductase